VVADEAAVSGSTYLVTQAWVDALIKDCKENGETFVLERR
jgi:hypothetical protein